MTCLPPMNPSMRRSPPTYDEGFEVELAVFEDEGRVLKVVELGALGVALGGKMPFRRLNAGVAEIELEVVAVGADHHLRKTDRLIAARPVEGGFEDDLFRGIALRLVEAGGGFVLAEDVGDTVVAEAVARAEVGMGVVVEGAPADAARILRIRRKLVVNAGVTKCVLALALVVVGGLGWVGVADKLGVEVLAVDGLLERKAEVVHGEDVFEELGLLEVPNAAGLA